MSILIQCPHCYKPIHVNFLAEFWICPWCQCHGRVIADKAEDGLRLKEGYEF